MPIMHLPIIVRRLGWGAGLSLSLTIAMLALGVARAQVAAPTTDFAYVVYQPGWNLISSGGQTDIGVGTLTQDSSGPLFTFQPNDTSYEVKQLTDVRPGNGYWANFTSRTAIALLISNRDSYSVTVPAGQCIMVGNPSTKGSARITGADRTYEFSNLLNTYLEASLVGIGRGAWACNDARSSTVSVAFTGDVLSASWPDCCDPQPSSNRGQGLLVFRNDSPAPIIIGARQTAPNGDYPDPDVYPNAADYAGIIRTSLDGCSSCPEYAPHNRCNVAAVTGSFAVPPGTYTLHIQSEDRNVPDLQTVITVDPDTSYNLCYFVDANRPQKALP